MSHARHLRPREPHRPGGQEGTNEPGAVDGAGLRSGSRRARQRPRRSTRASRSRHAHGAASRGIANASKAGVQDDPDPESFFARLQARWPKASSSEPAWGAEPRRSSAALPRGRVGLPRNRTARCLVPPRPRVTKLNDQRMRTSRRFWKPIRYQRWTTSQVSQARKPLSRSALDVGDGRARGRSSRGCPCRGSGRARLLAPRSRARTTLRRVAALLHRDRRDAGQRDRRAVGVADAHHVAEREDLGMPGQREVGLDGDAARRGRRSAPVSSASLAGERRRR